MPPAHQSTIWNFLGARLVLRLTYFQDISMGNKSVMWIWGWWGGILNKDQRWLMMAQTSAAERLYFCSLLFECCLCFCGRPGSCPPKRLPSAGRGDGKASCKMGFEECASCIGLKGIYSCQGNFICVFVSTFWLLFFAYFNKTWNILLANDSKGGKSKPNLSIALHLSELC